MPSYVQLLIAVAVSVLFGYGAGILSWIALNRHRRMSKPEMRTLGEQMLLHHATEIEDQYQKPGGQFVPHWREQRTKETCATCLRIRTLLKEAKRKTK